MKKLSVHFMTEYSVARNKPSSVRTNCLNLRVHILPALGRSDVPNFIGRMRNTPATVNYTLSPVRKMFNEAEF